jgi:hypothetical protein
MFTLANLRRITLPLIVAACAVGLGISNTAAQVPAGPRNAPNALLSIDQNRATVVDRIVADWGEAFAKSNAGIDANQLRILLEGMRADHLLAASLAGTLDGLRTVIAGSLAAQETTTGKEGANVKVLGDAGDDVVYTPLTPCRLVETRGTFAAVYQGGGPFSGGEIRNYAVQGGNGVCLTQLPAGLNPSAVQLQVFGIPINSGASGDIEILAQGAAFGNTATEVYVGNVAFNTVSTTAKINLANNQIGVQVRGGGANLAMDVVGYFAAPVATALQCTPIVGAGTLIPVSSDQTVAFPSCAAGYTRTGGSCSGTANVPAGYLVETNTTGCVFRNLSAVATYSASATSTCCRIPGR